MCLVKSDHFLVIVSKMVENGRALTEMKRTDLGLSFCREYLQFSRWRTGNRKHTWKGEHLNDIVTSKISCQGSYIFECDVINPQLFILVFDW
jgi:hypothetical protein